MNMIKVFSHGRALYHYLQEQLVNHELTQYNPYLVKRTSASNAEAN